MPSEFIDEFSDPDAKVLFRVSRDDETDLADVETLWAWNLGNDLYKLDNFPYFAYSVSSGDVVYAPYHDDEEFPTFQKVVEKSGNRTIRISLVPPIEDGNDSDRILKQLGNLGCEFEGADRGYVVLNVGVKEDFKTIVDFLIEKEVNFEYADPTYEEIHGEDEID